MNVPRPYDELQLLLKISQGDHLAFSTLFERHRDQLFTYLFKITKLKESSEEIVLDVFLKIWHGREAILQIEHFDQFLYRVAHNKAIDFLRAIKKNVTVQEDVWSLIQHAKSSEDADNSLLCKNAEAMIGQAIEQLSPQRQKVFYLHYHQAFTNEEIAFKLNLTKNTVRNHLFASVEFVRKYITLRLELLILLFLSLT